MLGIGTFVSAVAITRSLFRSSEVFSHSSRVRNFSSPTVVPWHNLNTRHRLQKLGDREGFNFLLPVPFKPSSHLTFVGSNLFALFFISKYCAILHDFPPLSPASGPLYSPLPCTFRPLFSRFPVLLSPFTQKMFLFSFTDSSSNSVFYTLSLRNRQTCQKSRLK